ncbi:MAG: NADH-quinone oxidoreductase subunit H [Deltaproteobacteria bacterium]|nr:NADH-quinone oxidoreductase subunit H [Deltaproteobacteria bacterium]
MTWQILNFFLALLLSPLLYSVINRTKAFFGGRNGPPVLQPYYDLVKLLRKGAVYSRTTSWIFRAAPSIELASVLAALAVTPLCGVPALLSFSGDLVFLAYSLGLSRFFFVTAALDTGSAFEGMGASREVQFSALAEVTLIVGLAAVAAMVHSFSLTDMCATAWDGMTVNGGPATLILVSLALLVVLLAENARIPVDDPTTHLELTMIHEVMILDHCGVDLAFIEYASAVKFWILGSILVSMSLPLRSLNPGLDLLAGLSGLFLMAVLVGVIESTMARLKLVRVPQLLVASGVLSFLALFNVLR